MDTGLIGLNCLTGQQTIVDGGMIEPVNLTVHADPHLQGSVNNQQGPRLLELTGWVSSTIAAELGRLRAVQTSALPAVQNLSNTVAVAAALHSQAPSITAARDLSLTAEEAALANLHGHSDFRSSKVSQRNKDSHQYEQDSSGSSNEEESTPAPDTLFDPELLHAVEIALETMQSKIECAGWSGSLAAYVFPGESLVSHFSGASTARTDCDHVLMVCAFDGSFGETGHVVVLGYASDRLVMTCDAVRVADDIAGERGLNGDIWGIHVSNPDALQASIQCSIKDESFAGIRVARQRLVDEPQTLQLRPQVAKWH